MVDDNAHAEASPAAAVAPDPDAAPAVERSSAAAAADGGDGAADGGGDLDAGAGTGVACEAAAESMADKSVANTCMANTGAAGPADTDAKAAMTGSAAVAAVAELPPDVRTTVEAAEALLETSGDAEAWVSLTDADLAATVGRYRDAVKALEAKLMPGSGVGGGGAAQPMTATAGSGHGASTAAASRSGTVAAAGGGDGAACASGGAGHALGAAAAAGPHTGCEVGSVDDLDPSEWQVPPQCIPIHANVTTYKWAQLYEHTTFDVIMMDPPWQLATANPTRGVSLGYSQLTDADIANLPVPQLQRNGFLFIWVINAKYKWTLDLFDRWGYTVVDEVVWCKMTVNRRLAKSHGYYLQHAKEVCLVGKRGDDPPGTAVGGVCSDVIFSERRGQSQKPEEVYELIEALVPRGRYLEIFARKNNLRDFWVSVGNEVTGTGLPEDDMTALRDSACIPNAVYGRGSTRAAA